MCPLGIRLLPGRASPAAVNNPPPHRPPNPLRGRRTYTPVTCYCPLYVTPPRRGRGWGWGFPGRRRFCLRWRLIFSRTNNQQQ